MTNIEKKVMTFLVFILLVNCFLIFAYQSNIVVYLFNLNPENSLETLIVFSLIGLHALFALLTMFLSLSGTRSIYRYYTLGLTALAPVLFAFINFRSIISYETDSYFFVPSSLLVFFLFVHKQEKIQRGINLYIKTLVNPLNTPWY